MGFGTYSRSSPDIPVRAEASVHGSSRSVSLSYGEKRFMSSQRSLSFGAAAQSGGAREKLGKKEI